MEGPLPRSSIFSSAPVVAAIISGITALLTVRIRWLLSGQERTTQPAIQTVSPPGGVTPLPLQPASPSRRVNLTHGVWTIPSSIDEEGTDFSGSTLKFVSQHEVPGGLEATGFFEWRGNQELIGR